MQWGGMRSVFGGLIVKCGFTQVYWRLVISNTIQLLLWNFCFLEIFKNFLLTDVRCGIITRDIVVYGKTSQTFIAFQKSVSIGEKKQLQS